MQRSAQRCPAGRLLLVWLLPLLAPACQDYHFRETVQMPLPRWGRSEHTQEGEVTLSDGGQAQVSYKVPFASPPRLSIVEFGQSWFKEKPYKLADFQIVQQAAAFFIIQNNHSEPGSGSWAVIKWRAEGLPAGLKADSDKTKQEQIISRIERLGGKASAALQLPDKAIISIDLHGTAARDADLEQLEGLSSLRSLNLYGTKITDAGLAHLAGLTSLQTLHLNSTAIGDGGLQHLRGLKGLKELGLYQTRVTDEGLRYLGGLTNLETLSLSGHQITDQGLAHLKGLRNLKRLFLGRTNVTAAGVRELERALPGVRVAH